MVGGPVGERSEPFLIFQSSRPSGVKGRGLLWGLGGGEGSRKILLICDYIVATFEQFHMVKNNRYI